MLLVILLASTTGGMAIAGYRAFRWLQRDIRKPTFLSSGFEYARCGHYEGWLSRDPNNNDWIIWCVKNQRTFRGPNSDALRWTASPETESECMELGRQYNAQNPRTRPRTRFIPPSRK